jgi:hypothetical protein
MIPDVQKLINQSGNVSIDIFNTRLIKPPTSVLVFPLKVGKRGEGQGVDSARWLHCQWYEGQGAATLPRIVPYGYTTLGGNGLGASYAASVHQ